MAVATARVRSSRSEQTEQAFRFFTPYCAREIRECLKNFYSVIKDCDPYLKHDWYRKNEIAGYEGYYASVFYCYFKALGLDVTAEDATNHGRIDLMVKLEGPVKCLFLY